MSVFFICWSTVVHWFFFFHDYIHLLFQFLFFKSSFSVFFTVNVSTGFGPPSDTFLCSILHQPAEFSYCCEHFFVAYPGMFLRTAPSRNLLGFLWLNRSASSLQLWKQRQCSLTDLIRTQIPAKACLLFPCVVWVINIAIWVSRLPGEKRNYSITNKLPQQHPCNCHFPLPNILMCLMRNIDVY